MTNVADIVKTMQSKFNAGAAAGLDLVFQFNIEDGDNHYLVVKDGTCDVQQGDAENPNGGVSPLHGIGMRHPSRPRTVCPERSQVGSCRASSGSSTLASPNSWPL